MKSGYFVAAIVTGIVIGSVAPSLCRESRSSSPAKVVDPYTGRIVDYSPKRVATAPVRWGDKPDQISPGSLPASTSVFRQSLGSAAAPSNVSSPGMDLYYTYMDDQYQGAGKRLVDFRGARPDIHFVYSSTQSVNEDSRFGYNIYFPITGVWPQGFQIGRVIQSPWESGQNVVMDVNSRSKVLIAGIDNIGGPMDNHFYYQSPSSPPGSGFFGAGTVIEQGLYNQFFLNTSSVNRLWEPVVEIQEWAGDTITHVLAREEFETPLGADFAKYTLNYFRKLGPSTSGTWTGPVCIDTVNVIDKDNGPHNGSLAASRVSCKVAVAYVHWKVGSPLSASDLRYDNDVWYRVSDSVGLSWGLKTNLTNYSRTMASYTSFLGVNALFDHDDKLHIVWDAGPTPAEVYSKPEFIWGDYSTNIWHWSNRTNLIAKVHNAEWGIDANTQVCGFGSPGTGYVGFYTMSECENRIYIVFSQYLNYFGDDVTPSTPANIDDCASGGFTERKYAANGELYMAVSQDLDGILWDAARNITKTYTPNCDSLGFGGLCANDTRSSLSRYGMDADTYDTNGIPVTPLWPGSDLVDLTPVGDPTDTGNNFIMMLYTEDRFPGPGYRDRDANGGYTYGRLTLNPLRFARLACVDPIPAPRCSMSPHVAAEVVLHGRPDTVVVTLSNEGNATLNISKIEMVKTTQISADWLGVTNSTGMTVPAGIPNTATFDILLNKNGAINRPGERVSLSGLVTIESNAPSSPDTIYVSASVQDDSLQQVRFSRPIWFIDSQPQATGDWGEVEITLPNFTGIRYFNLSVGDKWRIRNLPLLPVDSGGDGWQRQSIAVKLEGSGEATRGYIQYDYSLTTTTMGIMPSPVLWGEIAVREEWLTNGLFGDFFSCDTSNLPEWDSIGPPTKFPLQGHFLRGIPNQEACPMGCAPTAVSNALKFLSKRLGISEDHFTIDKMKIATKWALPNGCLTFQWPDDKADYMTKKGFDIVTRKYLYGSGVASIAQELDKQNVVEMSVGGCYWDWGTLSTKSWGHVVVVSGIVDLGSSRYQLTLVHDKDQFTNPGGTVRDVVVWNADKGNFEGRLWGFRKSIIRQIVVEGPRATMGCCLPNSSDGRSGNVDCDPDHGVDISDLSALIDFLYISYTPPCCAEVANIDGDPDGGIDISDLSALIDFLYISFTPPAVCR